MAGTKGKLSRPCSDAAIAQMLVCCRNGKCLYGVKGVVCTRIDLVREQYVRTGGNIHLMSGKEGCETVVKVLKMFPGSKIIEVVQPKIYR